MKLVLAYGVYSNTLLHPAACVCEGPLIGEGHYNGFISYLDCDDKLTLVRGYCVDQLGSASIVGELEVDDGVHTLKLTKKYNEPTYGAQKPIEYVLKSKTGWQQKWGNSSLLALLFSGHYQITGSPDSGPVNLVFLSFMPTHYYMAKPLAKLLGTTECLSLEQLLALLD